MSGSPSHKNAEALVTRLGVALARAREAEVCFARSFPALARRLNTGLRTPGAAELIKAAAVSGPPLGGTAETRAVVLPPCAT